MSRSRTDQTDTNVATQAGEFTGQRLSVLARIVFEQGPDRGRIQELQPDAPSRILLGTSPACEIRLTDVTVSRRHASFEPTENGVYRLRDLGSTNGTFVDNTRIVEAFVSGGEVVRFGNSVARLEETASSTERAPLTSAIRFGRTMGASVAMRRLYPLCEQIARSRIPVIIEGETGTGKEVLAESLHEVGGGSTPFVVFDCTTVSPNLAEAELFGHERGAFTGAVASRAGVFEEAHGGTLLIDEIGDLDLPLQAKLLRVIDRGELRRVGGNRTISVDVRVIAATRRDLDKEVAAGRFRDDLFHRLAVARIELPPLRDRHGDVQLLVRHFVASMGGDAQLASTIAAHYADYTWPGNARELRNVVARYVAFGAEAASLVQRPAAAHRPSTVPAPLSGGQTQPEALLPFPIARRKALDEFERTYVEAVLARHGGNVSQAAKASGLALRYFRLVKARQNRP